MMRFFKNYKNAKQGNRLNSLVLRIIKILPALILTVSGVFWVTAGANVIGDGIPDNCVYEGERPDFFYEILDDDTIMLTGYNNETEINVVIPSEIDGFTVTGLDHNFLSYRHFNSPFESITIPETVTFIKNYDFANAKMITVHKDNPAFVTVDGVLFDKEMTTLLRYSGQWRKKYTIPSSVTEIGDYAFRDSFGVDEVVIPGSVKTIGKGAFYHCYLSKISMTYGLKEIGDLAFAYCQSLDGVFLPNTLQNIGDSAFRSCISLEYVRLPAANVIFGDSVFERCEKLRDVVIPEGIMRLGNNMFALCPSISEISLPNSLFNHSANAFSSCASLKTVNVSPENIHFTLIDGVLFTKNKKQLMLYPSAREDSEYSVPEGTTVIGDCAFANTELTEIILPESLKTIGEYSFAYCRNIEEITVPEGVNKIGKDAFRDCNKLTVIVYEGSYAQNYAENYEEIYAETYSEGFAFEVIG
jgi:hypothetical protein